MIIGEDGTRTALFQDLPAPTSGPWDIEVWGDVRAVDDVVIYYEKDGHAIRAGHSITFFPPVG